MAEPGYYEGEFEVEWLTRLQGTIGAKVWEENEPPSRIIDFNDKWFCEVDWTLTGPMRRFICGTWEVDVYMESIGKGPEFELPDVKPIPLESSKDGIYSVTIEVPAGFIKPYWESWLVELKEHDLPLPEKETDIVYKMVCTVTYRDPYGQPGPIAGFVEMPMMMFYKAD
jgi:hypothetical protein